MKTRFEGMTLIELLLVMGVAGILLALVSPSLITWYSRQSLVDTTYRLRSMLVKAELYAINAKDDANWGVCAFSQSLYLFRNNCSQENFFDQLLISSPLSLSGDTAITFTKHTGFPDSAKSFVISNQVDSQEVQVNSGGAVQ